MEFSDLALAKFLQAAPELAPSIVNFSEVSSEVGEEGEVKVGLFLLRVGPEVVTVPVVGRGDTIFPVDSLFLENEGRFRPMTKSVLNTLMNAQGQVPGKGVKIPPTVDTNPNLNNLLNPPRTGKFVYASASRLTEFLAVLPAHVRKATFEKIASEQSLYTNLDKLFGLKAIFTALNANDQLTNATASGPAKTDIESLSVITSPREIGDLGDAALAKQFLETGYAVAGDPRAHTRAAVAYQPYNTNGTYHPVSPARDGGKDFSICFKNGSSKEAFLPKYHHVNPVATEGLASVFTDGSYATGELISNGDPLDREEVLNMLFDFSPPKLLRELERGQTFLMFTPGGDALGPFRADSVTRTAGGVEIKTYSDRIHTLVGSNNFTKEVEIIGKTMFVPHNVLVLVLGANVVGETETNVNNACDMKELITSQFLGAELDLRHDGVEFSSNGRPLGGMPAAMKNLVEVEKLDPVMAGNFLKTAQEQKYLKVFMSKSAAASSVAPTEMPEYGSVAPKVDNVGMNGAMGSDFVANLQSASGLGDAQVMESAIIGQLLQVPDLFEYIQEYLPDIDETVDKLGRVLFLTRVKIDQLSQALDSDTVFATIAQIKNVYKQLGDSSEKLKAVATSSAGFENQDGNLPG